MKSPAFQFYPADFLADENVVLMTNRELGCYIKLMCYCWREGSIPSDVNKIARLCGEDGSAMADLWIAISSCFEVAINDPSRLVHPRLVTEQQKQSEHKKERSESGKKGAEARWGKASKGNDSAISSAIEEPIAKDSSSSSSSSSSSKKKEARTRDPDAPAICTPEMMPEVDIAVAKKFIAHRKQVGAKGDFTVDAWSFLLREAAKAEVTPAFAVEYAIGRQWQSFTASYYLNAERIGAAAPVNREPMRRSMMHGAFRA
jgi:hypothetical protein